MDSNNRKTRKLHLRLASTFAILTMLLTGVIILVWYFSGRVLIRNTMNEQALDIARLAASSLDLQAHASFSKPADASQPAYLQMQATLQKFIKAEGNIRSIYTLRQSPEGRIVYVLDVESSSAKPAPIGSVFSGSGLGLNSESGKLNNQPYVERRQTSTPKEVLLTASLPLRTAGGEKDAELLVDLVMPGVFVREIRLLLLSLLIFVITIPIAGTVGWIVGGKLAAPIIALTLGAQRIAAGDLNYRVYVNNRDEVGALAQAFNRMADQFQEIVNGLEMRVAERTLELTQRSNYLEAAATIAYTAGSILNAEQMVQEIVEVIRQKFNLYYVGLFLNEDNGGYAVLKAGTGESGKAMLQRGHKIMIGSGMIGWSIANAQARVALQAEEDAVRLVTKELPETRSEAAVPLRSRGQVIGALSVQSERKGAFDQASLVVLQTLADLVAVALDNARLYAQSQQNLEVARQAYSQLSQKAWVELLRTRPGIGYRYGEEGLRALFGASQPNEDANQAHGEESSQELLPSFSLPIKVRGKVLGTFEAHKKANAHAWTKDETAMLENLIEQLSVALESARLYEETQRRAERERLASQITAKVRASNDPQKILQTAVKELREALQVNRAQVMLHATQSTEEAVQTIRKDKQPEPTLASPKLNGRNGHNGLEEVK